MSVRQAYCMNGVGLDTEDPMPVTAKLSRKFYERFGDDLTNELVNWFNDVDATYRSDLRELNELNYARFDAKLEQRLAELHQELRQEMQAGFAGVDVGFAQLETKLIRWMFVFWASSLTAMLSTLLAIR